MFFCSFPYREAASFLKRWMSRGTAHGNFADWANRHVYAGYIMDISWIYHGYIMDISWIYTTWLVVSNMFYQWEIQDPKMEVRKRTIFLAIFCGDIP